MKKLIVLLPLVLTACSSGYPATQTCVERDVQRGYCTKAEFSCKRLAPAAGMLVFEAHEARCV